MVVPIIFSGEVIGHFEVANKDTDYTEEDRRYIESLASYIAPVLNARLQRDRQEKNRYIAENELRRLNDTLEAQVAQRTAVAEKRSLQLQQLAIELSKTEDRQWRHIAQILHDDLQQDLAAIRFHLQMLVPRNAPDTTLSEKIRKIETLVDESIQKCRSLSHELSPPVLYQDGFLAALKWLAGDMEAKHGFRVLLETQKEAEPESPALASMLFRSVRELLFNAVKHSGCDVAAVEARNEGDTIRVSVKDNGNGFDPDYFAGDKTNMTGFGLFTIKERITLVDGRFDIQSTRGKGCRITLEVPKKEISQSEEPHAAAY